MDNLTYKIEVFEGPMDLLLHLISKHKLNINDIPIVELVNISIMFAKWKRLILMLRAIFLKWRQD